MRQKIEKDGLIFEINNSGVTVTADRKYSAEKVAVPLSVNGVPVTAFHLLFGAYDHINVKYISLPQSVKRLVISSFADYNINIEIDEKNPYFVTDGKAVYTKDFSELVSFLAHGDEEYAIRGGCKAIGDAAFSGAKNLRRVIFPKSLCSIGRIAFESCTGLEAPELPEGLTVIRQSAFSNCTGIQKIVLPSTLEIIGRGAFMGCNPGFTVELPEALREIGDMAFPNDWTLVLNSKNKARILVNDLILSGDGRKVLCSAKPIETEVLVIPDNAVGIASGAFAKNQRIEKVILPKTLRRIGDSAFENVQNLKEINLENVRKIGNKAFKSCKSLEKVSLKCDDIGIGAFGDCSSLTEAEVDCDIIDAAAFQHCKRLRKVILKNTRVLCTGSFYGAKELKEIALPYGLKEIEDDVFACSGIEVLTVPKTVKQIGRNIADGVREIHIYDNIGTDIGKTNDISKFDYTLYVHSAETDKIKYAVPVVDYISDPEYYYNNNDHDKVVNMFRGGADFDFKKFDSFFVSISDDCAVQKFYTGRLRLKYGYELDGETRRMYEEQLVKLAPLAAEYYMDNDMLEKIYDPRLHEYLTAEQLLPLIDKSARKNLTELTAFLMQLRNEKLAAEV